MGEPQKNEATKFLKFSGGEEKGGNTIFDLNLVRGDLEETIL